MPNFKGFNISKYFYYSAKKQIFQVWLQLNHHVKVYILNVSHKKGFLIAAFSSLSSWNYFYIQAKQKHFGTYFDILTIDGSSLRGSKLYNLIGCSVHSNT